MKKPAKHKPKLRRKKRPSPGAAQRAQVVARPAPLRGPGPFQPRRLAALSRTAVASWTDDQRALALLLLPFLLVAASLSASHALRSSMLLVPDLASRPAIERSIARAPTAPVPVTPTPARPGPLPSVEPVTPLLYPPAAPPIDVAALRVPAAPVPAPRTEPPVDVAVWSPPRPDWHDILRQPPAMPEAPHAPPLQAPLGTAEAVCTPPSEHAVAFASAGRLARVPRVAPPAETDPERLGQLIAAAAKAQTQDLVIYSARYQPMAYPLGDVYQLHGACTDVVIRAFRTIGIDLQELVQRTHAGSADTNIAHRRTETLRTFFARQGASLPVSSFPEDYRPGDVVTYFRPFSRVSASHIAIVSDVIAPSGRPMIIHNRGWGPQLEDALFVDRITGHYRYTGPAPGAPAVLAQTARRNLVRASLPGSIAERRMSRPAALPAADLTQSHAAGSTPMAQP